MIGGGFCDIRDSQEKLSRKILIFNFHSSGIVLQRSGVLLQCSWIVPQVSGVLLQRSWIVPQVSGVLLQRSWMVPQVSGVLPQCLLILLQLLPFCTADERSITIDKVSIKLNKSLFLTVPVFLAVTYTKCYELTLCIRSIKSISKNGEIKTTRGCPFGTTSSFDKLARIGIGHMRYKILVFRKCSILK
jgi:hypothetical protein